MMQPSVTVSEQRSAPAERKRTFATIPQTSQDNYITDMWALNLWDSDNEGGDWHARYISPLLNPDPFCLKGFDDVQSI